MLFIRFPDSFTSPLLDSDLVKAAQNPGTPSTYASSAVVRPVTYAWGEYTSFKALAWTEWTPQVAVGSGIYTYNTCKPDCASANYRSDPNVTLTFEDPKIVCGQWFFTRFEVKDTANPAIDGSTPIAPDRFSTTTDKTLIPTTPHHFVAQTDMGDWAGKPTSKDPTRIELALDYVKQWSYVGG